MAIAILQLRPLFRAEIGDVDMGEPMDDRATEPVQYELVAE